MKLTEIKDIHTHYPQTEESSNLLDVQDKCKRKTCEDLTLRSNKIIRTELSMCCTVKHSDVQSIRNLYTSNVENIPPSSSNIQRSN